MPLPDFNWDKPWVYGPWLLLFHGNTTLWTPALAQALLVSGSVRMTGAVLGAGWRTHLAVSVLLAGGTAAPWFASTLMPDIFAPLVVLAVFLVAHAPGRGLRACGMLVSTLAIAVHLAHLVLAAGCIAVATLLNRRAFGRCLVPLAAALALVLTANAAGEGQYGISPFGQIFLLARLVADGPARTTLAERCPGAGWRLCEWQSRLTDDSDQFLWAGDGPLWAGGYGPTSMNEEAGQIVRATLLSHPGAVLRAMAANTVAELLMVRVGDTLVPTHLDTTAWKALEAWFPPEEQDRYAAALQPRGLLPAAAAPFLLPHVPVLVLGLLGTTVVLWRGPRPHRALAVLVLAGLLANAASTGALSALHDRYQARIAWLLVLPPAFALSYAARRSTSSGDMRTSAS